MKRTVILFLMFILPIADPSIYVLHSEDSPSVEQYDCISHQSMYYCVRPDGPVQLTRNDGPRECYHDGVLHEFATLKANNVTLNTILHGWKSTSEKVEQYALYLMRAVEHDGYLCQCTDMHTFGKNCEYLLPAGRTFAQAAQSVQELKNGDPSESQYHGDNVCYTTLTCNSGLLCLDWRDLCDGVQQCMAGLDEENCDILEANECDEDEYRCMNGLCIPDEYFLDGEFDCLDWSDELQYYDDWKCASEEASAQCDDRYCPPNEWSCGDGQCIRDRLLFQKSRQVESQCRSRRDQYYLCQTDRNSGKWPLWNGRCVDRPGWYVPDRTNYTAEEECQYLLGCILSSGADRRCPCKTSSACSARMHNVCSSDLIRYPKAEIMAPYMLLLYNRSRSVAKYDADISQIKGTIKCGHMLVNVLNIQLPFNPNLREVEESLCRFGVSSSPNRYCQSLTSTFNRRSPTLSDICQSPRECISAYRLNDGVANCLNRNDEFEVGFVTDACIAVQRYRFRCSTNETKRLSVTTMGDFKKDCQNGYDELWMGNGRKLIELACNKESKSECKTLQRYIENSWLSHGSDRATEQRQIPFRSYCDTFWNLPSREDESRDECSTLWECSEDQWLCRSGQCIDLEWVLDGEWDCSDASDEDHRYFLSTTDRNSGLMNFSLFENRSLTRQERTSFNTICNLTTEFPCLRVNYTHSASQVTHDRLCISRDQLGDGHIDCYGAIDEQNTELHCDGFSMLGKHFKCGSSKQCIPYRDYCYIERCNQTADDLVWCHGHQKSPTWRDLKSAVCLDGRWLNGSRCNGKRDCPFGEDEYLCDYRNANKQIYATYRKEKQLFVDNSEKKVRLQRFPADAVVTKLEQLRGRIRKASLTRI